MADLLFKNIPGAAVLTDEIMKRHCSLKIGGPAGYYICPENINALINAVKVCREYEIPFIILGNATNVLISDEGFRGAVINTCRGLRGYKIEGNIVTAEAGVTLREMSDAAAEVGLKGMEFANGIPGTAGGAVYMNAGAYERTISDVFYKCEILFPDETIQEYSREQMSFSHRKSCLNENGGIVLKTSFALESGDPADIRKMIAELNERRLASQPLDMPSAGSVFKRPENGYAGKMIADCGLKGFTVGGAQVSEKHAGFIVNIGDASSADVIKLIKYIQKTVFDQYGVTLEPEIRFIGFPGSGA
jgi:UDP-N-acetylmuramate dehydrogenase